MRYNPPPTWPPPPPGWQPAAGWQAPPEWGPPPPGWQFWVDDPVPRPSVWSTIGIALASAVVVGVPVGVLVGPEGDVPYRLGYGVGQVLLWALLVGGLWPFVFPRASRWLVPLGVLVVGGGLSLVVSAATLGPGGNV